MFVNEGFKTGRVKMKRQCYDKLKQNNPIIFRTHIYS